MFGLKLNKYEESSDLRVNKDNSYFHINPVAVPVCKDEPGSVFRKT